MIVLSLGERAGAKAGGNMVTVVGHFPHAARGQLLRFVGHWVVHPTHGPQLSASAFEEVVPQSVEAIAAYLSSTVEGVCARTTPLFLNTDACCTLAPWDASWQQ